MIIIRFIIEMHASIIATEASGIVPAGMAIEIARAAQTRR